MSEQRIKAVQIFSQEEIFRAIAYGALKARAGRLASGEIFNIGEFELIVAEDENGEGGRRADNRDNGQNGITGPGQSTITGYGDREPE